VPGGDAFEIFFDVMSLPYFDSSYEPVAGWEKTTKFMAADGQYSTTARKVVVSYNQQHAFLYTDGKPAMLGQGLLLSRPPRLGVETVVWTAVVTRLRGLSRPRLLSPGS
jgi:hypothetical protein